MTTKHPPMARPAGIGIVGRGMIAIKALLTSSRTSTRKGGGISGGLARTVKDKYNEVRDSRQTE
jgi:hypothetical protein